MQGFVQWTNRQRLSWCKAKLPTAHWEVMRGTSSQASDYCKKDGDWQEEGVIQDTAGGATGGKMKAQHYREAIDLSKQGHFDEIQQKYPAMYWNHYSTMRRIAMDFPPKVPDLPHFDNEWIWGPPDTGKSYTARAENPDYYIKLHNKWWLGYQGESVAIYDDLSRSDANWIGDLLKMWGDRYAFPAETKNSGMVIRPKRIIVTSNYSPETLFCQDQDLLDSITKRYKLRHFIVPFNWVLAPVVADVFEDIPATQPYINVISDDDDRLSHVSESSLDEIEWTHDESVDLMDL